MIIATSSDGIALRESPVVITKPIMPKKRAKTSDNNKKIPPNIQRRVNFAPMLKSIVLPDPFGIHYLCKLERNCFATNAGGRSQN